MKNIYKPIFFTFLLLTQFTYANISREDIMGVWKLTKFVTVTPDSVETEWCPGANGSIAYLPGKMTVSINCESTRPGSQAEEYEGILFYSGSFDYDEREKIVTHRARNYSHPGLNGVQERFVEMDDKNSLRLVGLLSGSPGQVIVEWTRLEKLQYSNKELPGIYELVGSENEVEGSERSVPFCHGFYGSILYTPGGYASVSINCKEKLNPNIEEPADQFGRKYFYAGNFREEEGQLIQTIVNGSEPDQIGGEAIRTMSFDGDKLILTGTNGSSFKAVWQKQRTFVGIK